VYTTLIRTSLAIVWVVQSFDALDSDVLCC